jgi:hypothetical protein
MTRENQRRLRPAATPSRTRFWNGWDVRIAAQFAAWRRA